MTGWLTREEIDTVLRENRVGHIGCTDGRIPYVIPVTYVYDGKYIISHTHELHKLDVMRRGAYVCFEVEEIRSADNWKSIMVWGEFQELTKERERYYAMKLFSGRIQPIDISHTAIMRVSQGQPKPASTGFSTRPVIYRIVPDEIIGCYESSHKSD